MQTDHVVVIVVTFFGFVALAAMLLIPVWRFLRREEEVSRQWTADKTPHDEALRPNGRDSNGESTGERSDA